MTPPLDETHDPQRKSWVASADGHHDFPIQNLPLGVFDPGDGRGRGGMAIGDQILDLARLADADLLTGQAGEAASAAKADHLNALLGLSPQHRKSLRAVVSALLASDTPARTAVEPMLHRAADVEMRLPARIGDYTDFYAGIVHARTVGAMLRPDNPLMPNYRHLPIGYHGRASSIRVSGTDVRRPLGQTKAAESEHPRFDATQRLDYEVELGVWIGEGNILGDPIRIQDAERHIAGLSLLNDWSARDIQAWEYQPLGPFLAKNFASTISPWIVTAEALLPFRTPPRPRDAGDPPLLDYLTDDQDRTLGGYRVSIDVKLRSAAMRAAGLPAVLLGRTDARGLYWTPAQLVAHHTCGGCNLSPGDLLGTGTISVEGGKGYGSLMEASRGGQSPMSLPNGQTRAFLEDGDEVSMTGRATASGRVTIGFGECRAIVLPARQKS